MSLVSAVLADFERGKWFAARWMQFIPVENRLPLLSARAILRFVTENVSRNGKRALAGIEQADPRKLLKCILVEMGYRLNARFRCPTESVIRPGPSWAGSGSRWARCAAG